MYKTIRRKGGRMGKHMSCYEGKVGKCLPPTPKKTYRYCHG